jgi:hypothetical protein
MAGDKSVSDAPVTARKRSDAFSSVSIGRLPSVMWIVPRTKNGG